MSPIQLRIELSGKIASFIQSSAQLPNHSGDGPFNVLALEIFKYQFKQNQVYRAFCEADNQRPELVSNWQEIPALPTSAFKDFEVTTLDLSERAAVFFSSGTTTQKRGRHFHSVESLKLYETSLLPWFKWHLVPSSQTANFVFLTPVPEAAPNSSLVHMFGTVSRTLGTAGGNPFFGKVAPDGSWDLDIEKVVAALSKATEPLLLCGTAFSFVHLLDGLGAGSLKLPEGSAVLETGGYKGRSREVLKDQLRALITKKLCVPKSHIVSEYSMSELSSQAYDHVVGQPLGPFHFPPWSRAVVISPETGRAAPEGATGLLRIFDLANLCSVMAVQTEDLALKTGAGFHLLGRAPSAVQRGCSLMNI